MKNIEIEVRSFIPKEEYKKLLKRLNKEAKFVDSVKEETVYFSSPKDLRIRFNGKNSFLILKEGKIHEDSREETEVKCDKKDFRKLEELLKKLEFKVKIRWFRKRRIYQWKGIKVLLDDTKGYGFIIELEKIGKVKGAKKIYKNLKNKLKSLGIKITPKKVFDEKFKYYKNNWEKILNYEKN